ncbi:MAG: DUF1499 domain-containing protein [Spirochaetaceae bacterium]|nr:DUF1499 domain-containing protein [Myxococcales bacterium]MCB9726697.1 DUF1499 domain-containing protein [Spirochaetaceae bacterium]HPG25704.1 DUF1499 domain-containing protein [Myxococcota bacterium]
MRKMVWIGALLAMGCAGRMPDDLGPQAGRLRACPPSPNCVSSAAEDAGHAIAPFVIEGDARAAWTALQGELAARPRVEIVTRRDDYVHAVFTTRLMRYRDDVELLLDAPRGRIDVRSASRVGYGDMGANRARIESLRAALAEAGFVAPSAGR